MAAGQAALGGPTCPELCVPVEATLWTLVHEQGGLGGRAWMGGAPCGSCYYIACVGVASGCT